MQSTVIRLRLTGLHVFNLVFFYPAVLAKVVEAFFLSEKDFCAEFEKGETDENDCDCESKRGLR